MDSDGLAGSGGASDLARKTAERASHDIGVREKGQNKGKRVEEYQKTVGIGPGNPYCIAAICTWMKEAALDLGVSRKRTISSASCMRFLELNRKAGTVLDMVKFGPKQVPCVGVLDHGGGKGHAALIVGYDPDTGKCQTIEANSNGAGSREGGGVYCLDIRHLTDFAGLVEIE